MLNDKYVAFAIRKVGRKVGWYVRAGRIRLDEGDDFSQDLLHDIVAAMKTYNPARATVEGYITEIVARRSKSIFCKIMAARRRRGVSSGIPGSRYDKEDPSWEAERDLLDYRIDLEEVEELLPEHHAEICWDLRIGDAGEVANRRGVPEASVHYSRRCAQAVARKKNCSAAIRRFTRAATRREGDR